MALILKNQHRPTSSTSQPATVNQFIQVTQPAVALPQSTTGQLFRVKGGRVLVKALIGTVTTIIASSDPVLKISSAALNAAQDTVVGTAVDIASTVDITSLEVGGTVFVEGDGTALVKANAGCVLMGSASGNWVAPAGEIYATCGASKTGAIKWDIWYQPLDAGAFVVAATLTSGALTAAI